MFQTMMEGIKEESVRLLFNAEVQVPGADSGAAEAGAVPASPAITPVDGAAQVPGRPGHPTAVRPAAAAGPVLPAEAGGAVAPAGPPARSAAESASAPPPVFVKGLEPRRPTDDLRYTAPSVDGGSEPVTTRVSGGVVGASGGQQPAAAGSGRPARNAPCPCGSGRKYKRCHGDPAHRSTA